MTRASKNSLVLDGSEVKLRLQAERIQSKTPVHVDWVRFTVIRRNAPFIHVDNLFPLPHITDRQEPEYREWAKKQAVTQEVLQIRAQWQKALNEVPDADFSASTQALELAEKVSAALGKDYKVNPEIKKGHDFYRFRICIERNHVECGWVGFLSSGDSPRQQAQSQTIHCNIFGMACTFAEHGWRDRLADIVEDHQATLTRCDLALDFFDGYEGGINSIRDDYNNGLCNVGGRFLRVNFVGDWSQHSKGARSIYFGSREAGKETNCYEKGDQLFGVEAGSPWLRIELRYGNKLRVLPVDMLRRPADFFAGASDWHAAALLRATPKTAPEPVKTTERLPLETVQAECVKNLTWFTTVAAPTCAVLFKYLGVDEFLTFVTNQKLPGRLSKFLAHEVAQGVTSAFGRLSPLEGSPAFSAT